MHPLRFFHRNKCISHMFYPCTTEIQTHIYGVININKLDMDIYCHVSFSIGVYRLQKPCTCDKCKTPVNALTREQKHTNSPQEINSTMNCKDDPKQLFIEDVPFHATLSCTNSGCLLKKCLSKQAVFNVENIIKCPLK